VAAQTTKDLSNDIAGQDWYHTLELAPGIVTPGWFDTRELAAKLPWPSSLEGMRCLDIGTFDGFWAFEMERRGADEVVATDLVDPLHWDWPPNAPESAISGLAARKRGGEGFELARRAFGSRVERRVLSVYDLDPADIGRFDFVYLGSLLIHLRDPVGALERIRAVCRGQMLVVDNHDALLSRLAPRLPLARLDASGRPWWWQGNIACVVRMIRAAGFDLVSEPLRVRIPAGRGQPGPPLRPRTLLDPEQRRNLRNARRGDPHVVVLARPALPE
jgi:tRNA (mo5U34)-methyltransferase